jgi:hypothetical protein
MLGPSGSGSLPSFHLKDFLFMGQISSLDRSEVIDELIELFEKLLSLILGLLPRTRSFSILDGSQRVIVVGA